MSVGVVVKMKIDKEKYLKRFEGRSRPAPHKRAEMVNQVCDGLGVDKTDPVVWRKWNGVIAGIPLDAVYDMLRNAKEAHIPAIPAFTGNVRRWRTNHGPH